jgi:branched-chain amino acid transport system permease protein
MRYLLDLGLLWLTFFAVGMFFSFQAKYFRAINFSICVSFGLGAYVDAIGRINAMPLFVAALAAMAVGAAVQFVGALAWSALERGQFLFLTFSSLFLIKTISVAGVDTTAAAGSLLNLTNGVAGLPFIPISSRSVDQILVEAVIFAILAAVIIVAWRKCVTRRSFVFIAVGQDPAVIRSYGHSATKLAVLCFVLSGAGAGLAGAGYAEIIGYVDPNIFSMNLAARILVIGFLFPQGSLLAIWCASGVITILPELIRLMVGGAGAAEIEQIVLCGLVIIVNLFVAYRKRELRYWA